MTVRAASWLSILMILVAAGCSGHNQTGDVGAGDGGDSHANSDGTMNDLGVGIDGIAPGDGSMSDGTSLADATSDHVVTCPGCPCFPGTDCTGSSADSGTPPTCPGTSEAPTLLYPPDGVLLPPNTGVVEVQFMPGTGNTLFEIDFANARTDVRFITHCTPITNTRSIATSGCSFTVDMANWQYVADVNRGGDPVHVTVRATPDGMCVGSSATRDILFATEDVQGAIYYWQSTTMGSAPGTAGGIYRFNFGREDLPPEPFLTATPTVGTTRGNCIGCHFLARDGFRISYGSDDADSDDEYGDLHSNLMAVDTRIRITNTIVPGFRTFTSDHAAMVASDGRGMQNPAGMVRYDGNTGAQLGVIHTTARVTHPDLAPDDSRIAFVRPAMFLPPSGTPSATMGDDAHFYGGSIFTAPYMGATIGTPVALVTSTGENNYYPAFSPDGQFVIFNRAMGTAGAATDAFSNPHARIWAIPSSGGAPVDLARMNQGDNLTNSWPRWSPYVQHDRGHTIAWVTFSSTRNYGLHVQNEDPNGVSCYPPESVENPSGSHACPLLPTSCNCIAAGCANFCVQPQIWMAAVEIDAAGGISAGRDTSHPAFWLPFQDVTAHNHIAQWAAGIPGMPTPDGGMPPTDAAAPDAGTCGGGDAPCGAGQPLCCAAYECVNGTCGVP